MGSLTPPYANINHSAVTRRPSCFFPPFFFCCLSGFYSFTLLFLGRLRGLDQSEPGAAPDDPGPAGRVKGPARTALPVHVSGRRRGRQSVFRRTQASPGRTLSPCRSHSGPRTCACSSARGHCWQVTSFQRSRPPVSPHTRCLTNQHSEC